MTYDTQIEKLLAIFTGPHYARDVQEGKREFFERAGIVDEESSNFETRMSQFLDWFLFSRELIESHLPPVQFYLNTEGQKLSQEERTLFENLTKTKHSLFEFIKVKGTDVIIRDLFTKKKLTLENSYIIAGFNTDEVFEARVIPFEKTWVFAKGFCFHPPEATSFILKEIKKVRHLDQSHHEALMLSLLKMRYKYEQYKHIRLEFIYTNDGKLRI